MGAVEVQRLVLEMLGFCRTLTCHESSSTQPRPAGAKAAGPLAEFDGSILMFHWQVKIFWQGGEGARARAVRGNREQLLICFKTGISAMSQTHGGFQPPREEVDLNRTWLDCFCFLNLVTLRKVEEGDVVRDASCDNAYRKHIITLCRFEGADWTHQLPHTLSRALCHLCCQPVTTAERNNKVHLRFSARSRSVPTEDSNLQKHLRNIQINKRKRLRH